MTATLGLRPRLRSLHTSFLEAWELGHCLLEGEHVVGLTHPDGPLVWHLTGDTGTHEMAKFMSENSHPGMLATTLHGVAGQTEDGWALVGFQTAAFDATDKAARLLTELALDIDKQLARAGASEKRILYIERFRHELSQFDLLFGDDRRVLLEALSLCEAWTSSQAQDLNFHRLGSFVATTDGRIVLHPTIGWDRPF